MHAWQTGACRWPPMGTRRSPLRPKHGSQTFCTPMCPRRSERLPGVTMTITADDTRGIRTADSVRVDTQQAWDLAIGHNTATPNAGGGSVTLGGLARWAARRDPAGWVERRVSVPGDDEETRRR